MIIQIRPVLKLRDFASVLIKTDNLNTSVCYLSTSVLLRNEGTANVSQITTVRNRQNYQPIADFYAGKSVFITGGTGYLGKAYIEKLLYSCNDIKNIYVLTREKGGISANDRIQQLFKSSVFDRVKEEKPEVLKKVIPVAGDVCSPNLGLKSEDEQALLDKVSIVIHSAANVKFDEPLQVAMEINVEGTRKMLNLVKRMKHVEIFVHVSTAYTNTDKDTVQEMVYPPPAEIKDVYKFLDKYGSDKKRTKKLLNGQPNTYTFTKAIGETLVTRDHGSVPTIIVRPASVTPAKDEPQIGWVDNWYGLTGILAANAKGRHRVLRTDKSVILDLIPVDYVTNITLVAAARSKRCNDVKVYNCCSSSLNPITCGEAIRLFNDESLRRGYSNPPLPKVLFTRSKLVDDLLTFALQTIPAHAADHWLRLQGKEPRYVKLNRRDVAFRNVLAFFTCHSWVMRSHGVREMAASLSPEDYQQFPCDVTDINWPEYMSIYCEGVKRYLRWD